MEAGFLPTSSKLYKELATSLKEIFFLPEYVEANRYIYKDAEETGIFYISINDVYIWAPFIKRNIMANYMYFDITSPYGYGGVILSSKKNGFITYEHDKPLWDKYLPIYLKKLNEFCINNNIVTEFSRFHPSLKNHLYFEGKDEALSLLLPTNIGVVVNLDKDENMLYSELSSSCRRNIKKAKRENLRVEFSKNWEDFYLLYIKTLDRKSACSFYYFPTSFFEYIFSNLSSYATVGMTYSKEGRPVAAAIFLHSNSNFYYFLGGSLEEYLIYRPNNILFWEAILYAKYKGYHKFYLGGGYRNKDSLFHFKAGFSKDRVEYFTYRKIHINSVYSSLCSEPINSSFFPAYRG